MASELASDCGQISSSRRISVLSGPKAMPDPGTFATFPCERECRPLLIEQQRMDAPEMQENSMLRLVSRVAAIGLLGMSVAACSPLGIVNGLTPTDTYLAAATAQYGADARQ